MNEGHAVGRSLKNLRPELLALHRELLDSEKAAYEQTFGTISSSTAFLQLLTSDSFFAWLQPLNTLIAKIDAALADKKEPLTEERTTELIAEAKALLTPDECADGFGGRYHEAMQRDPHVILAHAALRRHWPQDEKKVM